MGFNYFFRRVITRAKKEYEVALKELFTELKTQANYQNCLNHFTGWLKSHTEFRYLLKQWGESDQRRLRKEIPQQFWDHNKFLNDICNLEKSLSPGNTTNQFVTRELPENDKKR